MNSKQAPWSFGGTGEIGNDITDPLLARDLGSQDRILLELSTGLYNLCIPSCLRYSADVDYFVRITLITFFIFSWLSSFQPTLIHSSTHGRLLQSFMRKIEIETSLSAGRGILSQQITA